MFEEATRNKYRFPTSVGLINVEDLWDLTVERLDNVYKRLNTDVKKSKEESLLNQDAPDKELNTKIEIVKHIFNVKVAEQNARLQEKDRKEKKQYLLSLIQQKQVEVDKSKSIDELQRLVDEL